MATETKKAPAKMELIAKGKHGSPCPKGGSADYILSQKVWASLISIYAAEQGQALIVREKDAIKAG